MKENNNPRMGLRDGLPICLGYLSVSFAFGIFATSSGLSLIEAALISATNVTSAGQLAGVPIIVAGGGFLELALTQLIINLRYALMSVSLSQKLGESVTFADRFAIAFVNTDEVFAVATAREECVGRGYMYPLIATPYFGWLIGTILGAFAGNILPAVAVAALGIAIYAMFIAIVLPVARTDRKVATCALLSVALSCAFYYIPALSKIPSGFVIIIVAVSVSILSAILMPISDDKDGKEEKPSEVTENA